jgi:SlyX protein
MEEKLIDLETKFSFQEDLLNELNNVVANQQKQIDELVQELKQVQSHVMEIVENPSAAGEQDSNAEVPPHY